MFRLLENAFVNLIFPLHNAIISPQCRTTPISLPKKVCPPLKLFWRNVLPYFKGGDCEYILKDYLPIELANADHIKIIFFRARESANVGPVRQCTWQEEMQEHQAKQKYTMLIIYLNSYCFISSYEEHHYST